MSDYSPRSRELASELRQKALRNLGATPQPTVTRNSGAKAGTLDSDSGGAQRTK